MGLTRHFSTFEYSGFRFTASIDDIGQYPMIYLPFPEMCAD